MPRPMVGVIIGKSGECINNIQQTCGVRLQFLNGKRSVQICAMHVCFIS